MSETAKRRTQAERRAESGAKLLRAAIELIGEKGYSQTTLEDIGLRAGYSRGLVSHRYGSKEGLARALIKEITRDLDQSGSGLGEQGISGLSALRAFIKRYILNVKRAGAATRAFYILMFESLGPLDWLRKDFDKIAGRFLNFVVAALEEAKAAGEIPADTDCRTAGFHIVASMRGFSLMWITDPGSTDPDKLVDEFLYSLETRFR